MISKDGRLVFDKAGEFLRQKVNLPTKRWSDLTGEMHSRAFVVAGAAKEALLTDFHKAINQAVAGEMGYADFKKQFDQIVTTHGWSYKGERGWRTRTIYYTNLSTAYTAGREAQMADPDIRTVYKYARYRSMDDGRVRKEHREWNNTVLPWDDPWWKDHSPPCGWGCRCWREPATEEDAQSSGAKTTAPSDGYREWKNPSTGDVERVPVGVDPGWNYDKGASARGEQVNKGVMDAWEKSVKAKGEKVWEPIGGTSWKAMGLSETIPIDTAPAALGPRLASKNAMHDALVEAFGAEDKVYSFPTDAGFAYQLHVNAKSLSDHIELWRSEYIPLLPPLLANPFEIWMAFERHRLTGKSALRVRAVAAIDVKKGKMVAVFNGTKAELESWTVVPSSDASYINNQRYGKLIWSRTKPK